MNKSIMICFFLWIWVLSCWGADSTSSCFVHDHELPIVVLICSYNNADWVTKNLNSVFSQEYTNYRIVYIDDCSSDTTALQVESYKKKYDTCDRLTVIANDARCRKMKNMYNGVHSCDDHEIIVQLDGDDWFCDNQLLARINHIYQSKDVWLTYGSYIDMPVNIRGYAQATDPEIIKKQSYRNAPWLYMPTRTFYAWLFKAIELKDFIAEQVMDYQGLFFPSADDPAFMFPMLEMVGDRFEYINHISYVANRANPIIGRTLEPDLQGACGCDVRHRKPYKKLTCNSTAPTKKHVSCDMLILSDNNPTNLARLLDSIKKHATGIKRIALLADSDPDDAQNTAYAALVNESARELDIQLFECTQLEECLEYLTHSYVLIAHESTFIKKNIHLADYLEQLEKTGAYGFYFAYSSSDLPFYNQQDERILITSQHLYQDVYAWKFNCCSFALFNNCDMTILRKADLAKRLHKIHKQITNSSVFELVQTWLADISINLHQVGLFLHEPIMGGTLTAIHTPITIPACFNPPAGRGYRTPMDIERKRCRKIRLSQERRQRAAEESQRTRIIKKRT